MNQQSRAVLSCLGLALAIIVGTAVCWGMTCAPLWFFYGVNCMTH